MCPDDYAHAKKEMQRWSVRESLPDLDVGEESGANGFVPAAKVFRKPPPGVHFQARKAETSIPHPSEQTGRSHSDSVTSGQRFEINLDNEQGIPPRMPLARPSPSGILRDVTEKIVKHVPPRADKSMATGFPHAERRRERPPTATESRFKASIRKKRDEALTNNTPASVPVLDLDKKRLSVQNAHQTEFQTENNAILRDMPEEEILEEQSKLVQILGNNMVDFLLRRQGGPAESKKPANAGVPPAHHSQRSPATSSLQTNNDGKGGDRLESTLLDAEKAEGDIFEDDLPEIIRRRYFPQEPMNASLAWMKSGLAQRADNTDGETTVKFDIQGQLSSNLHAENDHAGDIERHARGNQDFSLAELLQLSISSVPAQRSLGLEVIRRAAALNLIIDTPAQTYLSKSDSVNKIIAVCNRGLSDKHISVIVTSLAIIHLYATTSKTVLNTAAAILTLQPSPLSHFSRFLSVHESPVSIPPESHVAILRALSALANSDEDFICAEIVEAPHLLENVSKLFIQVPWPCGDPMSSTLSAIDLLSTLASRSRSNAEIINSRRLEQSTLRYIAVPPWSHRGESLQTLGFRLASSTLRLLREYASYGMGCSTLSSSRPLFRAIERWMEENAALDSDFSFMWFSLLETWSVCAIDPHSTTPEHDILWAETNDWGDLCYDIVFRAGQQLPITTTTAVFNALSAWLEGASTNDKPAYKLLQQRLREAAAKLGTMIMDASREPITEADARMLISLQRLLAASGMKEMAEVDLTLLDRVQIEYTMPATEAEDAGWI